MNKLYYRTVWNLLIYTHNQPEPDRYEKYLDDMLTQRNFVDVNYALITFNISDEHNGVVEEINKFIALKLLHSLYKVTEITSYRK